jgi:hypothetical protein
MTAIETDLARFYLAHAEALKIGTVETRVGPMAVRLTVGPVGCATNPRVTHSLDFASVNWFGTLFSFGGKMQRRVVAVLWEAWEKGAPDVSERSALARAESESHSLKDLFKNNRALGTLIQRSSPHGGPVGCFRLVAPAAESDGTAK